MVGLFFAGVVGAIAGSITALLAVLVMAACSTLFMYATNSWPEPEEVYIGFWEGMIVAILFYGGGAFLTGIAVGVLVWCCPRYARLRVRLNAMRTHASVSLFNPPS